MFITAVVNLFAAKLQQHVPPSVAIGRIVGATVSFCQILACATMYIATIVVHSTLIIIIINFFFWGGGGQDLRDQDSMTIYSKAAGHVSNLQDSLTAASVTDCIPEYLLPDRAWYDSV